MQGAALRWRVDAFNCTAAADLSPVVLLWTGATVGAHSQREYGKHEHTTGEHGWTATATAICHLLCFATLAWAVSYCELACSTKHTR